MPRVAVGLPVYNGERTVAAAIESILLQSCRDFVLVISDNCSTDSTSKICREYASKDTRIRYHRQPSNIGAVGNFLFVLQGAECEYFMWASADDTRSPDFIEVNLAFLESHSDYVSSTSAVRYENSEFDAIRMGDSSLDDDSPEDRFICFFSAWHANGRFYSLFRRENLLDSCQMRDPFLGYDWSVVLRACLAGKMRRCDRGWLVLGAHGLSSKDIFSAYRRHWHEWPLPLGKLFSAVWPLMGDFSVGSKVRLFFILLHLNLQAVRVQLIRSLIRPFVGRLNSRDSAKGCNGSRTDHG